MPKSHRILLKSIIGFVLINLFFVDSLITHGSIQIPTLIIAGDNNFPPYEYVDDNGQYKGFNVDIMNAVAIEMGIEIQLIPMPWNEAIDALNMKEVDAIQGMTYNDERSQYYAFTEPLLYNKHCIFVSKDNYYVQNIYDLSGKKVSHQKGDIVERIVNDSQCIATATENQEQAMNLLIMGSVEAFIGNRLTGINYLLREKQYEKIKIIGNPIYQEKYGVVTLKDNPYVYNILNNGILKIKKNGTYEKIYKKWFGEEFSASKGLAKTQIAAFLLAIFLIILFVILNRKLRKMINKRTTELEESKSQLETTNSMLHELAYYDTLTHLPNRVLFNKKLDAAIMDYQKYDKKLSVMHIDLDNFKYINNVFGHSYGNEILKETALRVSSIHTDQYFFSRLCGDEFALLVYNETSEKELQYKAKEIIGLINKPFFINSFEVNLTASIGIVICQTKNTNRETILRDVDIAMHKAKENGRNRCALFDIKMNKEISERMLMSTALLHAIENQEFTVFYQPIYDSTKNKVITFEALLRWNHPNYNQVPPEQFIKLAEEIGLIYDIGHWVIQEGCRFAKKINKDRDEAIVVSINLSPLQLAQDNFIKTIDQIINETEIEYHLIGLEITETTLINSFEKCMLVLSKLENRGMKIFLDDFGMGYSSLNYLWRLPISTVKIDRSFIKYISQNKRVRDLTTSIIDLCGKLDLETVAEGVETHEQLELLTHLGCTAIQGFLFSKPLSEKNAFELINATVSNSTCLPYKVTS